MEPDRDTTKDAAVAPALPSVTVTSETERNGARSSLTIAAVPLPSATVAPEGAVRFSSNVSSASTSVSAVTVTFTGFAVSPAAKLTRVDFSSV